VISEPDEILDADHWETVVFWQTRAETYNAAAFTDEHRHLFYADRFCREDEVSLVLTVDVTLTIAF
jgi:hypothetical protein